MQISPSGSPIRIKPMTAGDIDAVAELHREAFPSFFLTDLGFRALSELYRGMLDDPSGITLVAYRGGQVVGVAAGSIRPSGFYRRMLVRRWWRFATALVPDFIRRPQLIWRLAWRLRSATSNSSDVQQASLLSLAVAQSARRQSVGRHLVRSFLAESLRRGARRVNLTTDADNNEQTIVFYEKLGFRRRATLLTRENRRLHEYVADL